MPVLLIAHRSGPGRYPEQSIASARHSLESGADIVEMDIQYTEDGFPVICHDPSALRMFGVDKLVREMSFQEFMGLRQVQDSSYPSHSLQDVIDSDVAPVLFHCKISGPVLADLAGRLASAGGGPWVVGVRKPEDVRIIKDSASCIRVLSFMEDEDYLGAFLSGDADYIRLWEDWVTQERIDRIHKAGKQVWIMAGKRTPSGVGYTEAGNLIAWEAMGVDGILVNDIAWAKDVLRRNSF